MSNMGYVNLHLKEFRDEVMQLVQVGIVPREVD